MRGRPLPGSLVATGPVVIGLAAMGSAVVGVDRGDEWTSGLLRSATYVSATPVKSNATTPAARRSQPGPRLRGAAELALGTPPWRGVPAAMGVGSAGTVFADTVVADTVVATCSCGAVGGSIGRVGAIGLAVPGMWRRSVVITSSSVGRSPRGRDSMRCTSDVHVGRQIGLELGERDDRDGGELVEVLSEVVRLEGSDRRQCFVHDHAERPDVGALIDVLFAEALLGGTCSAACRASCRSRSMCARDRAAWRCRSRAPSAPG